MPLKISPFLYISLHPIEKLLSLNLPRIISPLLINTIKFWKLKELLQSLYNFVIHNIYNSLEYLYKRKSNRYIHDIIIELLIYAPFDYNNMSIRQYNFLNKLKEEFDIF